MIGGAAADNPIVKRSFVLKPTKIALVAAGLLAIAEAAYALAWGGSALAIIFAAGTALVTALLFVCRWGHRRLERNLVTMARTISSATGADLFRRTVEKLAALLRIDYVVIGEVVADDSSQVRVIAIHGKGMWAEGMVNPVRGTPFERVIAGDVTIVPNGIASLFPDDVMLVAMALEGYVGVPFRDASGRVRGFIAVLHRRPIPNPELAAAALQIFAVRLAAEPERARVKSDAPSGHDEMRELFDSALDAVIMMDKSGRITGWNRQAETIFGWKRTEAIGRALTETIVPPEMREAHKRGLDEFLATGRGPVMNRRLEMEGIRRDGTRFPVELAIVALGTPGRYTFSAFIRDITELQRADDQMARYIADVERSRDRTRGRRPSFRRRATARSRRRARRAASSR
jgi:PAS domain S-box-containing protein